MAKPEWGTKRTCHACGTRFYDLSKSPATCPKCGTVFELGKPARPRRRAAVAEPIPTPAKAAKDPALQKGAPGVGAFEDEEVEEIDAEEQDEDLIEDTSDLGEDEDDVSEIMEHIDDEEEHL